MLRSLLLSCLICGVSCTQNQGQTTTPSDRETIESLENRVGELEKKLADIETKVPVWDGVAEGVTRMLKQLENMPARADKPKVDPYAVYKVNVDGDPFTGSRLAKVTLVNAYDFYCGYCNKVRPTLVKLQQKYGSDLRIVYKEFVIHNDVAKQPALAACAAHKQNKFMPMFNAIWRDGMEAQSRLDKDDLLKIGKSLGLSTKKMAADMQGDCEREIRQDRRELAAVGTRGTPAFYVNGRFLAGALPIEHFEDLIDEELDKANDLIKAGAPAKGYYDHIMKDAKTSF